MLVWLVLMLVWYNLVAFSIPKKTRSMTFDSSAGQGLIVMSDLAARMMCTASCSQTLTILMKGWQKKRRSYNFNNLATTTTLRNNIISKSLSTFTVQFKAIPSPKSVKTTKPTPSGWQVRIIIKNLDPHENSSFCSPPLELSSARKKSK